MGLFERAKTIFKVKADKALTRAEDPREQLDYAYARQRELLQKVRRGVAEVTASRKRVELQATALRAEQDRLALATSRALEINREDLAREALERKAKLDDQLVDLAGQHAMLSTEEEKLVRASVQLQEQIDAFRIRKESIKAHYAAAEAQVRIKEAVAGISENMGDINQTISMAEDRTAQLQARACAVDDLIAEGTLGGSDSVTRELEQLAAGSRVEAELAQLKREIESRRSAAELTGRGVPNADDLR